VRGRTGKKEIQENLKRRRDNAKIGRLILCNGYEKHWQCLKGQFWQFLAEALAMWFEGRSFYILPLPVGTVHLLFPTIAQLYIFNAFISLI